MLSSGWYRVSKRSTYYQYRVSNTYKQSDRQMQGFLIFISCLSVTYYPQCIIICNCDTVKGNESHVEDVQFWGSYTTLWQLMNAKCWYANPIQNRYLVTELWAFYHCWKQYKTKGFEIFLCQYLKNYICDIQLIPLDHVTIVKGLYSECMLLNILHTCITLKKYSEICSSLHLSRLLS